VVSPNRSSSSRDSSLVGLKAGTCGITRRDRLFHRLTREHAEVAQLDRNIGLGLALLLGSRISRRNRDGLLLHSHIAVEFGLLLRLLTTYRVAIDDEEKLAFGDVLPFSKRNAPDLPCDARLDIDPLDGLNISYRRDLKWNILR
jgi:hypothetical protein